MARQASAGPGGRIATPAPRSTWSPTSTRSRLRARTGHATHASRRELQAYLEEVMDRFGLRPHLRLGEKIETVTWAPEQSGYEITTSSGELYQPFSAVISAVGFLNLPVVPAFARGEHPFSGVITHTSTWPEDLDPSGQRVGGVAELGSSAVQVVAQAARQAASVTVFQSTPNWILPKGSRDFSDTQRRWNRHRLVYAWRRERLTPSTTCAPTGPATPGPAAGLTSAEAEPRWLTPRRARPRAGAAETRHAGVWVRGQANGAQRRLLRGPQVSQRDARPARRDGAHRVRRGRRPRSRARA